MRDDILDVDKAELPHRGLRRYLIRAAFPLLLTAALRAAPIQPLVVTEPVFFDSDDPAIWLNRSEPKRSLVLGTCKHPDHT